MRPDAVGDSKPDPVNASGPDQRGEVWGGYPVSWQLASPIYTEDCVRQFLSTCGFSHAAMHILAFRESVESA
jgi:hypothetical protein